MPVPRAASCRKEAMTVKQTDRPTDAGLDVPGRWSQRAAQRPRRARESRPGTESYPPRKHTPLGADPRGPRDPGPDQRRRPPHRGLALATGRAPRISLPCSLPRSSPTTVGGHRFWEEQDPQSAPTSSGHFFKNVSMLGGLSSRRRHRREAGRRLAGPPRRQGRAPRGQAPRRDRPARGQARAGRLTPLDTLRA